MRVVTMAGGFGTRLRPLTTHIAKPLVPVGNVPIMEHTVRLLRRHGFTDLLVLLHCLPETISACFGDGSRWGVRIVRFLETPSWGEVFVAEEGDRGRSQALAAELRDLIAAGRRKAS